MATKLTDVELFESGRRARGASQCASLIVATNEQGERNYHNCTGGSRHIGPTGHYCGCGEEWADGVAVGPLTEVVFP